MKKGLLSKPFFCIHKMIDYPLHISHASGLSKEHEIVACSTATCSAVFDSTIAGAATV
jgi:hypothetical protein